MSKVPVYATCLQTPFPISTITKLGTHNLKKKVKAGDYVQTKYGKALVSVEILPNKGSIHLYVEAK
jgi:hypothetical protein